MIPPTPWPATLAGRFDEHVFASQALRGNPLGDPSDRPLWVYLPPGYDDSPTRRYPSIYMIQGYSGSLYAWRNRSAFRPTFPEAADALFATGQAPPCILVWVDAWTKYGGSQYVDSPGTGKYHTYLCDELVPFVDAHYRTLAAPAHRGIAGKSSGGFGALITPMLRPDLFGGLASHAGDGLYEGCYIPGFLEAARALRDHYGGSYARFWDELTRRPAMSRPEDGTLVMTYGCAAAFSALDDGTVVLPFDVETGQLIDEVWQRWLAWDPVRMAARHGDALRGLRAIWLDAGKRDEWYLDLAAAAFARELRALGVTDFHFELFEGTHAAIDYRYPLSLAYLAAKLS
jgi:S-formylglutathione hydrolase FrmB